VAPPGRRLNWAKRYQLTAGACGRFSGTPNQAYTLCGRATDADQNVQPLEQQWNFGVYGNNGIQRVNVTVEKKVPTGYESYRNPVSILAPLLSAAI
jgi:hypothetical protein